MGKGRTPETPVTDHFIYNKEANRSKCKYCEKDYAGKVVTNLRKHLESHADVHKLVVEAEESAKKRKSAPSIEPVKKKPCESEGMLEKFLIKKRITIDMDLQLATEACIELVTKNGRPFKAMDDSGFQKLVRPIFNALGTSMYRQKIAQTVTNEAEKEKNKLAETLKFKLVSIKLDLATRLGRSFIGVNVQFSLDGKLHLKTLSVLEMTTNHTGENVKSVLLEILQKFSISIGQVYSATIDNGSNVVKALNLCTDATSSIGGDASDDDESNETEVVDTVDEIIEENEWQEDLSLVDIEIPLEPDQDQLEEMIVSIESSVSHSLHPVRCAAHTLQLAVQDFLKDPIINKLILTSRKLVKKLRTTNLRYVLKSADKSPPIIDTDTRWSSTFNMLQSLLNLKSTCQELCDKNVLTGTSLSTQAWNRIEALVKILEPAKTSTDYFQKETLTAGEFHERWTKMKLSVDALNTTHAKRFSRLLLGREKLILSNIAVLSSMYMDPRYRNILTPAQIRDAREDVVNVAKRLLLLSKDGNPDGPQQDPMEIEEKDSCATAPGLDEDDDEYEKLLKEADKTKLSASAVDDVGVGTLETKLLAFQEELNNYEKSPRQTDRKIDIYYWWHHRPGSSELLRDVALTVLSLPVTQVSVERLFSGLHYILSDLKGNMNSKTIDDVLFLRTNMIFG